MLLLINFRLLSFRHSFKLKWAYNKYNFLKSFTDMHIFATSHTGWLEGACCSSVPHLHPARHPLTSSLEKEGSLFVMDSICLFPIPTVGNMETKPPSHFPFHSPLRFLTPSFPLHITNWALYDIIYLWLVRWEWDTADAHFFLLTSDMLFFRRKSNWSVTLCTTLVIQPPIVTPGTIFLRHIFMHSCVDLDTLGKILPVSLMEGCLGNS